VAVPSEEGRPLVVVVVAVVAADGIEATVLDQTKPLRFFPLVPPDF